MKKPIDKEFIIALFKNMCQKDSIDQRKQALAHAYDGSILTIVDNMGDPTKMVRLIPMQAKVDLKTYHIVYTRIELNEKNEKEDQLSLQFDLDEKEFETLKAIYLDIK